MGVLIRRTISYIASELLLARLMGQYGFAHWCLSVVVCHLSLSVMLPAGQACGRSAAAGPADGHGVVGWPTLHGGPVCLRPIRATHCLVTTVLSSKSHTHIHLTLCILCSQLH